MFLNLAPKNDLQNAQSCEVWPKVTAKYGAVLLSKVTVPKGIAQVGYDWHEFNYAAPIVLPVDGFILASWDM